MGLRDSTPEEGLLARIAKAFTAEKQPSHPKATPLQMRPPHAALNINWLPGTYPPSVYMGQEEPMQPKHLVDYLADGRREFPFIHLVDERGVRFRQLYGELLKAEGASAERLKQHIAQHFNINNHPNYLSTMQRLREEHEKNPESFRRRPLDFIRADISGLEADNFFFRNAKATSAIIDHAELPYLDAMYADISRARAHGTIMPYSDLRGANARLLLINDRSVLMESRVDENTQMPLRYLSRFERLKEKDKLDAYIREHGRLLTRPMLVQIGESNGVKYETAEPLHHITGPFAIAKPL